MLENIIIIIICIILTICFILFINRDKIDCNCTHRFKKYDSLPTLDTFREEIKNNSLEENIKLVKKMDEKEQDIELL
jgi:uncharacterized membrane protein (DUF106 family)